MKHTRETSAASKKASTHSTAEENLKKMKRDDQEPRDDSDVFTESVSRVTEGAADLALLSFKETFEHARQAFDSAKEAYRHSKETISHAKEMVDVSKASAKDIVGKMRGNPKPFIQAVVPGAIGAFLLFERARESYRPASQSKS